MAEQADLQPEANATPDGEVSAEDQLRETLGEDYDEFQSYVKDKKNWSAQQNKHNQAAAEARKEAEAKRDELALKAAELVASQTAKPDGKSDEPLINWGNVAQQLGIQDAEDPMTFAQAARVIEYVARAGDKQFKDIVGDLSPDEKVSIAQLRKELTEVRGLYDNLTQEWSQTLEPVAVAEFKEQYSLADEDDIKLAMEKYAGADDFKDQVQAAAKRSHEKAEKLIAEHGRSKRKTSTASLRAAAARGGAVGGKAPANPWGDLKKYNEENPPDLAEEAV